MVTPSISPQPIPSDLARALAASDHGRAVLLARQALDAGETAPLLFALRADWHEQASRFREASSDLEQAHRAAPDDAPILIALARCLALQGHFGRSATAARAAVALAPDTAQAHYHLGFALEQSGALDDARRAYEQAVALDPTLADAIARLAGLAARRGNWVDTRTLADRALALAPDHLAARFALIMADTAERRFAQAEAAARAVADSPAFVPQARANAFTFLADALDAQDKIDDAFAAYKRANAMLKALSGSQFERPGIETGRRTAARLASEFAAIDPARWRPRANASARPDPIFILGFPRSGTTLLGEILAGHPDVALLDEKPLLGDAIAHFAARPGGLARLAAADDGELAQWRAAYWRRVEEAGVAPGARAVVDKGPLNTANLPLIARIFPAAKIVFALRDPRDVVFACFRRLFALNPSTYEFLSLESTAAFYDAMMRLAERARAALPLDLLEMRNEEMTADPEAHVTRLCAFAGLAPVATMLDFAARKDRRAIASPGGAGLAGGVRGGHGRWRRYAGKMNPVLPVLAPWIRRFGYEDAAA